jgi:hypothetical protein
MYRPLQVLEYFKEGFNAVIRQAGWQQLKDGKNVEHQWLLHIDFLP